MTPSTVASREARVISAAVTASIASRIPASFSSAERVASNAKAPAIPSGTESVAITRTSFVDSLAAFSAAKRTLGLFGRTITCSAFTAVIASRICPTDGFIVWPPSITIAAPSLRRISRLPGPCATATSPTSRRRRLRGRVELREPALALGGLAPHVADLHPLVGDDPDGAADREGALGLVGVHVHLRDRRVARHEQRVAEGVELRVERVEVELRALDEEDGAEAELRLLVVDRLLA